MALEHFYDLPVYRLSENQYLEQIEREFARLWAPIEQVWQLPRNADSPPQEHLDRSKAHQEMRVREGLYRRYGPWRFNEVVGYIRLHFLGSQIRGEYFAVRKRRLSITRTKVFLFSTWKLAPEISIPYRSSSAEIYNLILEYIEDCSDELPGRHIDTNLFEAIGRHVDWRAIFEGEIHPADSWYS